MRETTKCEGAATVEDLEQYASGLVCLTGGDEGPVAAALMHGGESAAVAVTEQLVQLFGQQNVYVELQRHGEREEEWRNQAAIRIAHRLHLPLLATNGVRYATAYDGKSSMFLLPFATIPTWNMRAACSRVNGQRHLRDAREMTDRFSDLPHAIANTVALSERLEFELDDLGYEFPRYPVPEGRNHG
jgi:error-prone DNA polymerase